MLPTEKRAVNIIWNHRRERGLILLSPPGVGPGGDLTK